MFKNRILNSQYRMATVIGIFAPVIALAQSPKVPDPTEPSTDRNFEIFTLCLPVIALLGILFAIIIISRIKAENKIRQQLIEKGVSEETLKNMMLNGNQRARLETLKWGFVIGGTGIGIVISQLFSFGFMTFATVFIFISIGLISYYFLSEKFK